MSGCGGGVLDTVALWLSVGRRMKSSTKFVSVSVTCCRRWLWGTSVPLEMRRADSERISAASAGDGCWSLGGVVVFCGGLGA